ncbi:hypothetical protein D9M72_312280 [compost metagenome]
MQGHLPQVVVDLVLGGAAFQAQVQDGQRHVRGGNADGAAGELAQQLGQCLGDGLGGTGFGDHHVQRGGAAATVALVEVVDQVLVVGEGVHRLDVSVDYAELVVDGLQDRGDGVGGAGRGRHDLVRVKDGAVIDAVDDVLQLALARRREQDAGNALAQEVLGQAFGVAPASRVIHDEGVLDAVGRVVHG